MKILASALLILFAIAGDLASDLLIRARGLDKVNGINASSWDIAMSILLIIGMFGFVWALIVEP